jgi:hypothetical protein
MSRITPRIQQIDVVEDVIGCVFSTNLSPTMRAQLIGYKKELGYFQVTPHEEWDKYNDCAGEVFWIPLAMVVSMKPMNLWCCLDD